MAGGFHLNSAPNLSKEWGPYLCHKRVYELIPIPKQLLLLRRSVDSLVNRYLEVVPQDKEEANRILLQIDAEILRAYELPPKLERQLLDIFWKQKRRVPFDFSGYIPPQEKFLDTATYLYF